MDEQIHLFVNAHVVVILGLYKVCHPEGTAVSFGILLGKALIPLWVYLVEIGVVVEHPPCQKAQVEQKTTGVWGS